ncbi:MAG: hypothetical protein HY282_10660 [Nitrospirae bacterium]|nr:hypothetical protein [Candidatus Manganitrophaceae bacterium]
MNAEELEKWMERVPKGKKKMPALKGVRGRVKFEAEGGGAYLLQVDDGEVELRGGGDSAEAVVICESKAEIARLLRGEAHPVVEALQGRAAAGQGDRELALRVVLELRGGSPFIEGKEARKKEGAK